MPLFHKLVNSFKTECLFVSFFNRFCATRWIKDEAVAERALSLWLNIVKLIINWEMLPKSKRCMIAKFYLLEKLCVI